MNSRVAVEICEWDECEHAYLQGALRKTFQLVVGGDWWACGKGKYMPKYAFTPTTDLNHARLAWDKLSESEQSAVVDTIMEDESLHGGCWPNVFSAVLDPLKLCEAMLAAKGGG